MQTADLLTLFTRAFSAFCLTVIAGVYAMRRDYFPAVLFFAIAAVVWRLAFVLYQKLRAEQSASPPEEKP